MAETSHTKKNSLQDILHNPQLTPYSTPLYCKVIATKDGEPFRCAIADETAAAKATCLASVLAKNCTDVFKMH